MNTDYQKAFGRETKGSRDTIPPGTVCDAPIVVLVADDDPTSRRILTRTLHQADYEVISVVNGDDAKEVLLSDRIPDIALLDWVMPGVSGPALCELIREHSNRFVYTVLITAKTALEDVIFGLESGAHEFLSKPINLAEFNVRMNAAVRLLRYERELSQKNEKIAAYAQMMEELAQTRAKQLVHAERLATLGMLSAGIGHEIKNPVAYVSGNVQILKRYRPVIQKAIGHALETKTGDTKKLEFVANNLESIILGAMEGLGSITTILQGLNKYAYRGVQVYQQTILEYCIDDALELSQNTWKYHVSIQKDCDSLDGIHVNSQEITQVIVNLLVNASDSMKEREDGKQSIIDVSLKPNGAYQRIVVADNGPGIPDKYLEKIWNPFFTTKPSGEGTGLGLAICSGIVEEHGGEIFYKNLPSGGACFVIDLPLNDPGASTRTESSP